MPVRRATSADIPELIRLRRVMYDAMDVDHSDPAWAQALASTLESGFADESIVAFVVDEGDGRLRACGVGVVYRRLPSPRNPSGRHGHVQSMATDPDVRRRGYARAVFAALLDWFDTHDVRGVDLHATPYGEPLYRSFGFTEPPYPALGRRR